jgi:mannose-1-phosphate guanylyltransferase
MSTTVIPMILAGGKGERFWPLSRRQFPKQFLSLDGTGVTLLQATADRFRQIGRSWDEIWVVTASHLAQGVRDQLPELPEANLLVEPEGRDTAPAVTWATLEAAKRYGEEAVLGLFPADHWIVDLPVFAQTLEAAAALAVQQGAIATLGIQPTYASTGYGYIEQGESLGEVQGLAAYRVSRFREKPDAVKAAEFLASGRFSWNSGMFIFQAGTAIAELRQHAPDILEPLAAEGVAAYGKVTKTSIDYALMEKTDKACVLPVTFGWDDLGDWNAIERLLKGDAKNVELGAHEGLDSQGNIIYVDDSEEVVATLGVEDLVIVRAGKATLIVHKDRTQEIKQLLKQIQGNDRYQSLL